MRSRITIQILLSLLAVDAKSNAKAKVSARPQARRRLQESTCNTTCTVPVHQLSKRGQISMHKLIVAMLHCREGGPRRDCGL